MNQANLCGRLTRQPEVTLTTNGKEMCRFTIAVNRTFKNAKGEYEADFINCVAYGTTAKYIGSYIDKGRLVSVTGRIQTGSYERDGQKVYTTDIIADSVQSLEKRETNNQNNNFNQGPAQFMNNNDVADDLPF